MLEAVRLERLARVDVWLACDGIPASLQSMLNASGSGEWRGDGEKRHPDKGQDVFIYVLSC